MSNGANNLSVGLANYVQDANTDFGQSSQAHLQDLHKALSAGNITGRDTDGLATPGSGAPLKVESLEKNLRILTYKESDIVAWRSIPKLAAYNTVEEYNLQLSYGAERGGFHSEGGLPEVEDSKFQRSSQLVKYIGNTRGVTLPATLVRTNVGSLMQVEIKAGTMWVLRAVNRALFYGSEKLTPLEFNGIFAQHEASFATVELYTQSEIVIDLRGNRLSEENIEEGVRVIVDNFGEADCIFAPPVVLSNFTKFFYKGGDANSTVLRNNQPASDGGTKVGRKISHFQSQFGEIELKFDKFLNKRPTKTTVSAPTHPTKAPDAPTAVGAVVAPTVNGSLWGAGDAGDYFFAVSAENEFGESALGVTAALTIAAGGAADITITSGATAGTSYTIYRSNEGAVSAAVATFFPIFRISNTELAAGYDGGAAGKARDMNRFIPNTDTAFLLQNDIDIWSFKQLAPLMKMDLAVVNTSYQFMVLLYGTPFLYQPKKMIRFINIGLN